MRGVRVPALFLWLVVLWVGLWGSVSAANVVGGILVALGVLGLTRTGPQRLGAGSTVRPLAAASTVRPLAALHFLGYFLVKLVQSNLVLAWEIVTPGSRITTGIIAVPLGDVSDGIATLVANAITLTPGTLTVEVRRRPEPTVYVHVLHLIDVEAVRADVRRLAELACRAFAQGTR